MVNQVAGTQMVDHCYCALHVDATYLTIIELTMWPCVWLGVCGN